MGDHKGLRLFAGAVGLLLVAIFGPLTLLSLLTDSTDAISLLAWTVVGFALWSATVAGQAGLGFRVAAEWMVALLAVALGLVVVAGLLAIVSLAVFGATSGRYVSAVLVVVAAAWAVRHPRLAATLRALGHACMARASAEDSRRLAGGPRAVLRPDPPLASTSLDGPPSGEAHSDRGRRR